MKIGGPIEACELESTTTTEGAISADENRRPH